MRHRAPTTFTTVGFVAVASTLTACSVMQEPIAPQYTMGQAIIDELSEIDIQSPSEPLPLERGSFIDDPNDEVLGGARAVFGVAGQWRVMLDHFGIEGVVPRVTIRLPEDSSGVGFEIYGYVGSECRIDDETVTQASFEGAITCERMQTNLPGRHRDISTHITFEAAP